ncbi:MAG: LysR family transcriptional regulator [Chloroflexi bacterium]|jgi:DNA-binding transcriptional LysR family regulator|uniref:LysR family transcriptional regulator n=1 Tax=Candidatus Chlorohelix allophototropha TaxID=3003348 RepID=A0A8T7LRK0_9CHLR|nr:LysR family transcriptional regulator [Chloroflexota bacterium]WJW66507.1 LysR family transcriptional regulator [Chloroflexota bacterium L227-S17]
MLERELAQRIELRQLLYFVTVVKEHSFSRAAEVLNMGQPGLSGQIKKLEDAVGIILLERTAKGVKPTEAGQQLLAYAQRILNELKLAERSMDEIREVTTGHVILGVTSASTFSHLAAIIEEYRRLYPRVQLQIVELPTETLVESVRMGLLDLTLSVLPVEVEELEVEHLYSENLRLIVSSRHRLADRASRGEKVKLPELLGEPLVLPYRQYGIRQQIEHAYNLFGMKVQTSIELMGIGVAVQLARRGLGITFLPELLVADEVRLGELVCLTVEEPDLIMRTGLLFRRDAYLPPACRRMVEVIQRVCRLQNPDQVQANG